MLTLLLQSRATGADADRYYQQFYERLRELTGLPDEKLNPVRVSAMRTGWPPKDFSIESRTHSGCGKFLSRFFAATYTLLHSLGGAIVFSTGLPVGWLNPKHYKNSVVMRSDFRKFDGLLRMVLDIPAAKIPAILEFLEIEHRRGAIFYGTHRSDSALMTCIIFSVRRDSHVHFIDGNDGGYALAALQFKQQIKAAAG